MIIKLIFIICFAMMFTTMITPLQKLKSRYNLYPDMTKNYILKIIYKLMNCSKCLSFQITIIFIKSFMLAVIVAVITEIISKNQL